MKNGFFSENGKMIRKMLLTHLVMTIFGMMIFIPFNTGNPTLKIIMSILGWVALLMFLFLIDVDMWYYGAEDKLRVDAGRQKRNPFKGLLIGLVAEIPAIVVGILFTLSYYLQAYYSAYESGAIFDGFKKVMIYVNLIWNGMYHGVSWSIFDGFMTWFYLFIPLLPIGFCGLTYWLGLKNSPILKPPAREKKQK